MHPKAGRELPQRVLQATGLEKNEKMLAPWEKPLPEFWLQSLERPNPSTHAYEHRGGAPKGGGGGSSISSGGGISGNGGSGGGSGGSGGGFKTKKTLPMVAASWGSLRVKVHYDAYLPSLSLRDGENLRSILTGAVLPTLRGHVLCKNWHMCGVYWEDCKRKNSHIPTPPEVANTIAELLKVAQGG